MSWKSYEYRPYVTVAERRRQAEAESKRRRKQGQALSPVHVEGRLIARTFWGKAWCTNLEGYSDYDNRLPRGRTYVRNGSVIDLQIGPGQVSALVQGSELYKVHIAVKPVPDKTWAALRKDCAGSIGSLVELLQGKLSQGVMERICQRQTGLFPSPQEITLRCSCPDWASMCKHVAAVLYGVGARLDEQPELLFTLRQVDHLQLIAEAGKGLPASAASSDRVLASEDLGDLFGLDLGEAPEVAIPPPTPAPVPVEEKALKKPRAKPSAKLAAEVKQITPPSELAERVEKTRAWVARLDAKVAAGQATEDDRAVRASLSGWLKKYGG